MSTNSKNADAIANIEALLNSGVVQTSQDGTTTTFDTNVLERRLKQLKATDTCSVVNGDTRPVMFRANFGRM